MHDCCASEPLVLVRTYQLLAFTDYIPVDIFFHIVCTLQRQILFYCALQMPMGSKKLSGTILQTQAPLWVKKSSSFVLPIEEEHRTMSSTCVVECAYDMLEQTFHSDLSNEYGSAMHASCSIKYFGTLNRSLWPLVS